MANITQVSLTIPSVNMVGFVASPSQTAIGLVDGTTFPISAGSGGVSIPLVNEPAARASGLRRADGQNVPCRLMQAPTGSALFTAGATILLPDGLTQTTIGATGATVIPSELTSFYQNLGFRVLL